MADSGAAFCSFGSQVITTVVANCFDALSIAPKLVAAPDVPEPTSYGVTENFKVSAISIAEAIFELMKRPTPANLYSDLRSLHHDVPDSSFTGPF